MPLCITAKLALLDFFFSTSGWSKGQTYDASSREAAWRRMVPLLLCGGDRMKFRVVGRGASELAVDQGKQAGLTFFLPFFLFCKVSIWLHRHVNLFPPIANAPPVPLSQVPPNCGYNMQRNLMSLVMMVPYDGCSVVQEVILTEIKSYAIFE